MSFEAYFNLPVFVVLCLPHVGLWPNLKLLYGIDYTNVFTVQDDVAVEQRLVQTKWL